MAAVFILTGRSVRPCAFHESDSQEASMTDYVRSFPLFSLCGLACGLCPRYHTEGASRCPGCGGPEFALKHPSCAVVTCMKRHDGAEFCFECSSYPCDRFSVPSEVDSFITYKKVIPDFARIRRDGLQAFREDLEKKIRILERLLRQYNDGRRKNFYCLAVTLLDGSDLEEILSDFEARVNPEERNEKIPLLAELFERKAGERNIELKLRKKG